MSHQEKNYECPEEELGAVSNAFQISRKWKILVSSASISLLAFCALYVYSYLSAPETYASPSDLDLTSIVLFAFSALFIVWVPWHALGVRITKIGGIEFKEIVEEQASEHAEEISYLQDRIEVLEANFRERNGLIGMIESFEEPKLRKLLLDFFAKYKRNNRGQTTVLWDGIFRCCQKNVVCPRLVPDSHGPDSYGLAGRCSRLITVG